MTKPPKALIFTICGLFILLIVVRVTHMFTYYRVPTSGNYPTIKVGDLVFASNLIKPKRFDMVCYYPNADVPVRETWVQRLCGIEGDKVEIKNGEFFINDKPSDANLTLAHSYVLSPGDLEQISKLLGVNVDGGIINQDTAIAYLSDADVKRFYDIKFTRLLNLHPDEEILKKFNEAWSIDNFGPVVVPAGKYFLLGDNRNNSMDSRYQGFIDKSQYVATVIGK